MNHFRNLGRKLIDFSDRSQKMLRHSLIYRSLAARISSLDQPLLALFPRFWEWLHEPDDIKFASSLGRNKSTQSSLLREFERTPILGLFESSWRLTFYFWVGGISVTLLAALAHVNGLALKLTGTLTLDKNNPIAGANPIIGVATHLYGYLGEVNHGLTYILVAPLFVFCTLNFVRTAETTLSGLIRSGKLITLDGNNPPVSPVVNNFTRKCFLIFTCIALVVNILVTVVSGIGSYRSAARANFANWSDIGYVQAPYLQEWKNKYDKILVKRYQLQFFSQTDMKRRLEVSLMNGLNESPYWHKISRHLSEMPSWQSAVTYDQDLRVASLNIAPIANDIEFKLSCYGGPDKASIYQMSAFVIFLIFNMILESVFHTFVFWAFAKIVFWMIFVYVALRRSKLEDNEQTLKTNRFAISPFLFDDGYKYGLGTIHSPYNSIVITLAIGGCLAALMSQNSLEIPSNVLPEFSQEDLYSIFGRILSIFGVITVNIIVLVVPIYLCDKHLAEIAKRQKVDLEEKLGLPPLPVSQLKQAYLHKKLNLLAKQSAWPKDSTNFRVALFATVAFLIVPWISDQVGLPPEISRFTSVPKFLNRMASQLCLICCDYIPKDCGRH